MFTGVKLYALLGIGALVLALSGATAFLWQMHKADRAELEVAKQNLETVSNALKQSEEDKAGLAREIERLNEAVKREQQIQAQLERDKKALSRKLDELKPTLPKEDQSCMDRALPPSILDLLRDESGSDAVRHQADSGKPS